MIRIALLGIGNIGFRHFQSLMELQKKSEIYVIDSSENALIKAEEYENSINNIGLKVFFSKHMDALPEKIDVAIIATSSLVRQQLFECLLEQTNPRYVIFEKFLFPKESAYEVVRDKLQLNSIKGYINCPSRLYPGYVKLKKHINKNKGLNVFIHGSNWGLACNAIHAIDKIGYLLESYDELKCDGTMLDNKIHASKRSGYVEFTGNLVCRLGNKATVFLNSSDSINVPFETVICNGDKTYIVSEINQTINYEEDGQRKENVFPIIYQSQLTASIVTELVNTSSCGLTRYEDTMQWHLALLRAFKTKYDEINGHVSDSCPIT